MRQIGQIRISADPFNPPRTVIAYHGTRAPVEAIRTEGLKVPDPDLIYAMVEDMRVTLDIPEPPKWAQQAAQHTLRGKKELLAVHLTFSKEQARRYARQGGEIYVDLGHYLLYRRYSPLRLRKPERIRQAWEDLWDFMRGPKQSVVTVEIPWSWLPERVQRAYLLDLQEGRNPEEASWDIPIFQDIPPNWVRTIEAL